MVQIGNEFRFGGHVEPVAIVGTGFTVMDRIYVEPDSTRQEALGGSCGNVLISLAMLHHEVAPVLALGLDEVGSRLVDEFAVAGATTTYIRRSPTLRSPVLAQHLDTRLGRHSFTFTCPETQEELPRYQPIDRSDLDDARPLLTNCTVFYTDRISDAIVEAMETAASSGAIVFFEPSDVSDSELFARAVAAAAIMKFSADRLDGNGDLAAVSQDAVVIVTHGEAGLEVRQGSDRRWCTPYPAPAVRDTCGSGDMVSVGLIDWLVASRTGPGAGPDVADVLKGVMAGQRLAAENCAFEGARGLFKVCGASYARRVLTEG